MKTQFSKWLEQKAIQPQEFAKRCGIDLETLNQLISDTNPEITHDARNKLRKAIRAIEPTANTYDFWSVYPTTIVQDSFFGVS